MTLGPEEKALAVRAVSALETIARHNAFMQSVMEKQIAEREQMAASGRVAETSRRRNP